MKGVTTILAISLFLMAGCGGKKQSTDDLFIVDVTKSYPKKEVILQNIADIEYIPLETTDDVLLGRLPVISYVSDKYIVVRELGRPDIFVFNRNGTIATHFNHQGQGSEEYIDVSGIVFDEKNEEIFVQDILTLSKILVYSLTGEYKRTLKFSNDLRIRPYNFDDSCLLLYDEYNYTFNTGKTNEKPYMLVSKQDGSIVSALDIKMPVRYANRIIEVIDPGGGQEKMFMPLSISTSRSLYYGQDFVISDISSDTIYLLEQNSGLTPLLVRKPSVHASEPRKVWTSPLTTEKFIILDVVTLDFYAAQNGRFFPTVALMYEFETGETYEVSFIDVDYGMRKWTPIGLDPAIPKNEYAWLFQVVNLKTAYEGKKLKGELEQLVSTLDVEDNPVVQIIKFK